MTPYQRCLATAAGQLTDRAPAYTPTICSDVASKLLGRPVQTGGPELWFAESKAWLRGPTAYAEFEAEYLENLLALNRLLDIEVVRYGYRRNIKATAQPDENTLLVGDPNGVHQVWRWDAEVQNFIEAKNTAPKLTVEDWPRLAKERQKALPAAIEAASRAGEWEARLQKRLGEEMLVAGAGGGIAIGHDEPSLMACILEPGAVGDMLDCQLAVSLAQMEALARRGIKVVLGGGDMADKNGPMYSPRVFRDLLLPRLTKLAARCRELGLHYVWRTDGKLWPVSDMIFVEAGVPGYGEVDYEASMTVAAIRARYPHLVIWANLSGDLIRRGTAEEVYQHALAERLASGGRGYFHGCSNTILPGAPPENVWAMIQARG
jgi:hypothetical protein